MHISYSHAESTSFETTTVTRILWFSGTTKQLEQINAQITSIYEIRNTIHHSNITLEIMDTFEYVTEIGWNFEISLFPE